MHLLFYSYHFIFTIPFFVYVLCVYACVHLYCFLICGSVYLFGRQREIANPLVHFLIAQNS